MSIFIECAQSLAIRGRLADKGSVKPVTLNFAICAGTAPPMEALTDAWACSLQCLPFCIQLACLLARLLACPVGPLLRAYIRPRRSGPPVPARWRGVLGACSCSAPCGTWPLWPMASDSDMSSNSDPDSSDEDSGWTCSHGSSTDNDEEAPAHPTLRGQTAFVTASCPRKYPRDLKASKPRVYFPVLLEFVVLGPFWSRVRQRLFQGSAQQANQFSSQDADQV